jgi:Ca2+-transporting ATPase
MRNEAPNPADMNLAGMEPYRRTVDDVPAALGTDRRSGLSLSQAQERLERYGRNELTAEAPVPEWQKFLAQFTTRS